MQPCHRFFFALRPPLAEARRIGLVRDRLVPEGVPVLNDRLHVTLAITRDYAAPAHDVAERLQAIGDRIDGDPFTLSLDRLSGGTESVALRPSRRPPALAALQQRLDAELRYWGLRRDGWEFNPHVTLGYRRGGVFIEPVAPITWEAREMVLIHSIVGRTQHVELGRWMLVRRQLELFSG
jgi:RNA 2',3'-cyclic 3'-phosphodiesterase